MSKNSVKKNNTINKNIIFLSGKLSSDVKVYKSKSGVNVASIKLEIVSGDRKTWLTAVSFGETVDIIANGQEGDFVELVGHCSCYKHTKIDGTTDYTNSFVINKVISINLKEVSDITIPEMDDIPF